MAAKPKTSAEYLALRDEHEAAAIAAYARIAAGGEDMRLLSDQRNLAQIADAHLEAATYFATRAAEKPK